MRLGIMQPYFFPNLAHFALIAACDEWIVFDVTQYTRKSWINRNRILHPKKSWQFISVPLMKSSLQMKIFEARVADISAVHQMVLGKLGHYKKAAPFYDNVVRLVGRVFEGMEGDELVKLNINTLKEVCEFLELPFSYRVCSQMGLEFPSKMGPGDWAPFICGELGATDYVNPSGGRTLFDVENFKNVKTNLHFADFQYHRYDTGPFEFIEGLSILDALMWVSPGDLRKIIHENVEVNQVV